MNQDFQSMSSIHAIGDQDLAHQLYRQADILDGKYPKLMEKINHRELALADKSRMDYPKPSRSQRINNALDKMEALFGTK